MKSLSLKTVALCMGLSLLLLNTAANTHAATDHPAGIYCLINLGENDNYPYDPVATAKYLDNPAVSGVSLRIYWSNIEVIQGNLDAGAMGIIDSAIQLAKERGKNVMLLLIPGFRSPDWLMESIPSCDIYLDKNCSKAEFIIPYGPQSGKPKDLPLPWDQTYLTAWKAFLTQIANRYNSEPTVVSIAVAGPTSVSAEFSLPKNNTDLNTYGRTDMDQWTRIIPVFYPEYPTGSNKVFTDVYKSMIQFYASIFDRKTIIVTEGQLPRFSRIDNSDTAIDEIMTYFCDPALPIATNTKSLQTSSLRACRSGLDGRIGKIKQYTLSGIYGGDQFGTGVVKDPSGMGCADPNACIAKTDYCSGGGVCCYPYPPSYADAANNALRPYFDGTPYGPDYCDRTFYLGLCGTSGNYKMHFLQIYRSDFDYLTANPDDPLQGVLNKANRDILAMSGLGPPADYTPPVISSVASLNITSNSANIIWVTDEPADSQVEYGLTNVYDSTTALDTAMLTDHVISLTGLLAETTYHYRARSKDAAGNLGMSIDYTFTTLAPLDTQPPTVSITSPLNGAIVTGTITFGASVTDNVGVALVQFKLDKANLGAEDITSPYEVLLDTKTIADGQHTLTATARDTSGNQASSSIGIDVDNTLPVVSKVTSFNLSPTSTVITWITDEPATSLVEYGTADTYGKLTPLDSSLVINHRVTLSGLKNKAIYHYRVQSEDKAGNFSISQDFTFIAGPSK